MLNNNPMKKSVLFNLFFDLVRSTKMRIVVVFIFQAAGAFSQAETSVLFIGNSLTFSNNMPFKFKEIAESYGRKIHVDTVVKRGMDLNYHSNQKNTFQKIRSRKWTYVVIQGHSTEFARSEEEVNAGTKPYAKKIIDSIRKNYGCTKILFYETWGYKNGISTTPLIANYDLMQSVIEKEYLRFTDVFSVGMVPVGAAWRKVVEKHPTINLYNEDLYHPTKEGSYVAACSFYTSIFRVSAANNTAKSTLPKETRYAIEVAAAQTILGHFDKWRLTPKSLDLKLGYDVILQNNRLELTNRAESYKTIYWTFGDGATSKNNNPKHVYKKIGTYTITQKISNNCDSKTLSRKVSVEVVP
jgi:hypothetical protein